MMSSMDHSIDMLNPYKRCHTSKYLILILSYTLRFSVGMPQLDFWYDGRDRLDILVPPHRVQDLSDQLITHNLVYSVPYNNVQT